MEEKKVKAGSVVIGICLFVISILLILIVLFFYNSKIEKNNLQEKISELKTMVEEKDKKVNELENKISKVQNVISQEDEKYIELTEKIYNDFDEDEFLVIQEIEESDKEKIIIKGRKYKSVKETKLDKTKYDELLEEKSIMLFGEKFTLGEYVDYVPGYTLRYNEESSLYISKNDYTISSILMTCFSEGTDEYYYIDIDNDVKLIDPSGEEINLKQYFTTISNFPKDDRFVSVHEVYLFEFKNKKLVKINIDI